MGYSLSTGCKGFKVGGHGLKVEKLMSFEAKRMGGCVRSVVPAVSCGCEAWLLSLRSRKSRCIVNEVFECLRTGMS